MKAPLNLATTLAFCLVLGVLCATGCWWLARHSTAVSVWAQYLPGVIFGVAVLIAGQGVLGWPPLHSVRAAGSLLACCLGWRLALLARLAGAPVPWMSASIIGALAVAAAVALAWPHHIQRTRLVITLAMTGVVGGLCFMLASQQRLLRDDSLWPLTLISAWQSGLLIVTALCLRPPATTGAPNP